MRFFKQSLLAASISLVSAIQPPPVPGFRVAWSDDFLGCQGCAPSDSNWNIAVDIHTNNELQTYTTATSNLQLSGGETLQLVPWRSPSGQWTSSRVESKGSWAPQPGRKMLVQAALRFGDNGGKQGMWPAFWMLGDSMRHGTPWPLCGEIDIFEQVNGDMRGHGTIHCGDYPGGACNEPQGRGAQTGIPDNQFHTWSLLIDRTPGSWEAETITWMMDGNVFHSLSGSDLGDMGVWATLAHSPLYILLNVAVGGNWPGNPNEATQDGYGSMMEVLYVGVYEST